MILHLQLTEVFDWRSCWLFVPGIWFATAWVRRESRGSCEEDVERYLIDHIGYWQSNGGSEL
jgi:hypothetical protein